MTAHKAPKSDPKVEKPAENKASASNNPPVEAQQLPSAPDTVRVRFKRGHPALAYSLNEEADLPRALYEQHLGDGEFFEKI